VYILYDKKPYPTSDVDASRSAVERVTRACSLCFPPAPAANSLRIEMHLIIMVEVKVKVEASAATLNSGIPEA